MVVTHLHGDHVGGLAAVKAHTGRRGLDGRGGRGRWCVQGGGAGRWSRGPALFRMLVVRAIGRPHAPRARSGRRRARRPRRRHLPLGATAVHTPGHTAGHLALLFPRDGGVLFAGDAATNLVRLGVGPIYEDVEEGLRSLRRLSGLEFETALFAHGRPLAPRASERFRARFGV